MNAVSTGATHHTGETQRVGAAGVDFACRRFGGPAELPLVMLQHFRGNLDNWDPALTDALAAEREVILVDYAGVGSSTGEPSNSIASTARQMIAFIAALGLDKIDIAAAARGESKPENLLYIMFAHTEASQAKGMEFLGRFMERQEGRDAPTSDAARDAQMTRSSSGGSRTTPRSSG